ncbi:hypothetical protein [Sphaerimonospora thailandensis]|uniref:Uncharacterized protein n=1 Tax=Sphaerimonospora thailandensis TaxID=795644 RepID=A0A8J3R9N5_9ACTN|nr:hypothetical protein [Sphaerimonospora thailandensis]GIH70326.1 hypothetical protein Mth01_25790 [Sphaerimonospora thailandensis]
MTQEASAVSSGSAPIPDGFTCTDPQRRLILHQGDADQAPRQNLSDWIEPLPRLQVLPLPGDQFALVLSGYRDQDGLDLETLTRAGRECGAKTFMVFDQHIEVG